jgi:hypothetical protein
VLIGQRRGSIRVWRDLKEAYEPSVIRRRWKGFSEFMFWGCFSYDYKGPCHIWEPETPAIKKAAEKHLKELNTELKPILKAE